MSEYRIGVDASPNKSVGVVSVVNVSAAKLKDGIFEATLFLCRPWEAFILSLEAESVRQRIEHEQELDLSRERELNPETEIEVPDVVPAELVLDWDAYAD
jgi:hypothetical protein